MALFDKYDRHAGLVGQMAGKLGVDMTEKFLDGKIGAQTLRGTVLQCMSCKKPGACEQWLNTKADGAAEQTPEYCENKVLLEELRKN
ncbi:DUF6455 family protein [Halocynthiibacter sp.]|uniref:DUF6455 family protein n=1 Tax=Halocynthiibacter sp. TaxID=1979210 RepID=UPI003C33ECB9